jgi:cytoskeletal protein RodZ
MYYRNHKSKIKSMKKKLHRKNLMIRGGVVAFAVLLVAAVSVWWWHGHNKNTPSQASVKTSTYTQTPNKSNSSSSGKQPAPDAVIPNPTPNPTPNVPGGTTNSTPGTLAAPTGTLVSNHSPSLSDANRNQEVSVCNTTPGASCEITFTLNGVTKSLGVKTADDKGTASWDWTPQSVGLTVGSWQIQAIATWHGQTMTGKDSIKLSVQS